MRSLILILVLPAAVLLAAVLAYRFELFAPAVKNQGELLAEPVNLVEAQLKRLAGTEAEASNWRLMLLHNNCPAACFEDLHQLRTVHDLTSGVSFRVERWLIVTDAQALPLEQLQQQFPYLRVYQPKAASQVQQLTPNHAYIIDPLGNVILRYSIEQISKPMLQDLKRLIKISRVG